MKKYQQFIVGAFVTLFGIGVLGAAMPEFFVTLYVRTLLHVYGKAVFIDSARVQGTFRVNGATTHAGAVTNSSTLTQTGAVSIAGNITTSASTGISILDSAHFFADSHVGRPRLTVGAASGTGTGKVYAGDSLYIGSTLFADASRNVSATAGTFTGNVSAAAGTFTGLVTLAQTGAVLPLHAIAAGDSVVGKIIFDAADSTLKVYDGATWRTAW